jgi:hypothetical protein
MNSVYPLGHFMRGYSCEWARQDIDFYFSSPTPSQDKEAAMWRALEHMTADSTPDHHNVSCQACWKYYEELKQKHCGG